MSKPSPVFFFDGCAGQPFSLVDILRRLPWDVFRQLHQKYNGTVEDNFALFVISEEEAEPLERFGLYTFLVRDWYRYDD